MQPIGVLTCQGCAFKTRNPIDPLNVNAFICLGGPPQVVILGTGPTGTSMASIYPPVTDATLACAGYLSSDEGEGNGDAQIN